MAEKEEAMDKDLADEILEEEAENEAEKQLEEEEQQEPEEETAEAEETAKKSFFKKKEKHLYKISDYIGCMSPANKEYIVLNNQEIPERLHP